MKNSMLNNVFGIGREIRKVMKKKPKVYSREWVNSVSEEEFYRERENLRQAYLSGDTVAWTIMKNLDRFLSEMQHEKWLREHPGEEIHIYHTEHGYHLSEDDD